MPAFLPRHPRTRAVLLWTLFALTSLVLVVMIVYTLVAQFDPASEGTPGTAVITRCQDLGSTSRRCYGTFRTDDATVHLADTQIFGEDFAHPGQRFTAYYDASDNSVDTVTSADDLVTHLIVVGWLLVLAFAQFWFRIMIPRQRRKMLTLRSALDNVEQRRSQ